MGQPDKHRFFYERKLDYCPVYDSQTWAGIGLRVATPLLPENAKRMAHLEEVDPEFMDGVYKVFPEARVQARYWNSLASDDTWVEYGRSFTTIAQYIEDVIDDPDAQRVAREALKRVLKAAKGRPLAYPPSYVFQWLRNGATDKMLMALRADVSKKRRHRDARKLSEMEERK